MIANLIDNEDLVIRMAHLAEDVCVGLDYCEKAEQRLQLLCCEVGSTAPKVIVGYDASGRIVEVQIWRGIHVTQVDGPRTPLERGPSHTSPDPE